MKAIQGRYGFSKITVLVSETDAPWPHNAFYNGAWLAPTVTRQ